MTNQVVGYYTTRQEKLLRGFDTTSALMSASLIGRYGEEFAKKLHREARRRYKELIPKIPYINGLRARMLNTFLLISAQELAVYKAMAKHGKPPGEAWELCHEALRLRLEQLPRWKRRLMRQFMFSRFVKKIMARRASQEQKARFGNFEIEYLIGQGDDFDFGVNYHRCGNYEFVKRHGGEEFAPYVCMSDIALSQAMGWGLRRTQTLADGCPHCDFRFKYGATTRISSKTRQVQETIERISQRETEQGAAGDD
jgi:hypothetical protein